MPIRINYDQIQPKPDAETLILTANDRKRTALISGFMQDVAAGDVIKSPAILSISQWQNYLWEELSFFKPLPKLLDNLAIKIYLKQQIEQEDTWQLTHELGAAEKVLEAYQNLSLWNLAIENIKNLQTVESRYFVKWIGAFEKFTEKNNYLPRFKRWNYLLSHIESLSYCLPKKIILVGFNRLTPMEESFFEKLKSLNIETHYYASEFSEEAQFSRLLVDSFQDELKLAARMAESLMQDSLMKDSVMQDSVIQESPIQDSNRSEDESLLMSKNVLKSKSPLTNTPPSIGIVVNQLSAQVGYVHEVFSDVFHPDENLPNQPLEKLQYNVSAGQSLINQPIVDAAIKLLLFSHQYFDWQDLIFLKNSPFIDWGENKDFVRAFLHKQSLLGRKKYSYSGLLKAITKSPLSNQLMVLKERIEKLQSHKLAKGLLSDWTNLWQEKLIFLGWVTNANEYEEKVKQAFIQALQATNELNSIYTHVSFEQARDCLLQSCKQQTFQLPSDRSDIQIMGVLEAVGLEFDELILVGFNSTNWPQKHQSNPFIPISFQKDYAMPGCSVDREYQYTEQLSNQLLKSANKIWITQSRTDTNKDISGIQASTFFADYPLVEDYPSLSMLSVKQDLPSDYEWHLDETIALVASQISGGARLISEYAACPFKAMSHFILRLEHLKLEEQGLNPKLKGLWLHKSMELIWDDLKDQKALLALTADQVKQLVESKVAQAEKVYQKEFEQHVAVEVIAIEKKRLSLRINDWLQLEKERDYFSVEAEVEKTLTIGELDLKLRLDRVDYDASGHVEIIDYKTGKTDVKYWLDNRPEEAQMPAYALAFYNPDSKSMVKSLSYAQIKTGDIKRLGVWFKPADKDLKENLEEGSEDASKEDLEKKPDQLTVNYEFLQQHLSEKKSSEKKLSEKKSLNPRSLSLIDEKQSLFDYWQTNLKQLADKIIQGEMPVSPKSVNATCRYCDYQDVCRITENQPEEQPSSNISNVSLKEID